MPRAARTCIDCPAIIRTGNRCPPCETRRGTASQRGYNTPGHQRFRQAVLARDPICTTTGCHQWATVADHYPDSRRELIAAGLDPDNPQHGRGLCKRHHDQATALHHSGWGSQTPGG